MYHVTRRFQHSRVRAFSARLVWTFSQPPVAFPRGHDTDFEWPYRAAVAAQTVPGRVRQEREADAAEWCSTQR